MSRSVEVAKLPRCDFCGDQPVRRLAKYDGRTLGGQWGYMCQEHFEDYGIGLGTGKGQRLILKEGESNGDT